MENDKIKKDWHFENDNDKLLGVETIIYKNENSAKRVILSDGKTAVIRELNGKDMIQVDKFLGATGEADKYYPIMMHFATKIDGEDIPLEAFDTMKGKDFNKIKMQVLALNF